MVKFFLCLSLNFFFDLSSSFSEYWVKREFLEIICAKSFDLDNELLDLKLSFLTKLFVGNSFD